MGFIEDEVKRLSASVEKLESRIRSMEERAFGGASKQSEEIRMILIGPPGAGAFCSCDTLCGRGSSLRSDPCG